MDTSTDDVEIIAGLDTSNVENNNTNASTATAQSTSSPAAAQDPSFDATGLVTQMENLDLVFPSPDQIIALRSQQQSLFAQVRNERYGCIMFDRFSCFSLGYRGTRQANKAA